MKQSTAEQNKSMEKYDAKKNCQTNVKLERAGV
jgi:hypothetical protein